MFHTLPASSLRWPLCARCTRRVLFTAKRYRSDTSRGYNVLFFGTDPFSIAHLAALLPLRHRAEGIIKTLQVVTPPDKPKDRGYHLKPVPLKTFAQEAGLAVTEAPPKTLKSFVLPPLPDDQGKEDATRWDIGVVVSFGYLIPATIIRHFAQTTLNVHPSLLPRYRGAAPLQHTLLNGDTASGLSVTDLSEGLFDAGHLLKQLPVAVERDETFTSLHDRMSRIGADALADVIANLPLYLQKKRPQASEGASHAPKINKDIAQIAFHQHSAELIWRRSRAIAHQCPLHTLYKGEIMQLLAVRPIHLVHEATSSMLDDIRAKLGSEPPGAFYFEPQSQLVVVKCHADSYLFLEEMRLGSKKRLKANDFINGQRLRHAIGHFGGE